MKITVAKYNKDSYIIIENGNVTITYKAKMLMKTSEITYTGAENIVYESEVFEAEFLRKESNEDKPVDISSLFKKVEEMKNDSN